MIKVVALSELHPHPRNPRIAPRDDVIEQLATQMAGGFDEAHALIVRPVDDGYQIISGHQRTLAAEKAGLKKVPCWVRKMSDDDAYMALVLNNAQGELSPLEIGLHALGSGLDQKTYAEKVGVSCTTLQHRWYAAEVAQAVPHMGHEINDQWRHLSELHSAPQWLWSAFAAAVVKDGWTVENVRKGAQRLKETDEPPVWADKAAIAEAVISGTLKLPDVKKFGSIFDNYAALLSRNSEDAERLIGELLSRLQKASPSTLSVVQETCLGIEKEQAELIRQRQQADLLKTKEQEEIIARIARLRTNVSLEEWKTLSTGDHKALLSIAREDVQNVPSFNKQENNAIEWAQWSWNPVTGCLHNCPYCYARDIAKSARMAKAYPHGFEPAFRPAALLAPRHTKVPDIAKTDTRFRNVFTCSMADLFGRWVPAEWIEAVLNEIRNAPQWNFLCLTKFPKRMSEFDIPPNAWMGTTVDLQARVVNAEAAFTKVKSGVKWLSIEPMLESLKFKNLEHFDWIVIGGASSSQETPEWYPPFEWIIDLVAQARAAGTKVYFKTNLLQKRILELPFDAPIPQENEPAPAVFHYLGKNKASVEK